MDEKENEPKFKRVALLPTEPNQPKQEVDNSTTAKYGALKLRIPQNDSGQSELLLEFFMKHGVTRLPKPTCDLDFTPERFNPYIDSASKQEKRFNVADFYDSLLNMADDYGANQTVCGLEPPQSILVLDTNRSFANFLKSDQKDLGELGFIEATDEKSEKPSLYHPNFGQLIEWTNTNRDKLIDVIKNSRSIDPAS